MRVFITGALGYIGSRLIQSSWRSDVEELVLVDNLSTERPVALFDLSPGRPVRFLERDIRWHDLRDFMSPGDCVIHLAARTGTEASLRERALVEEVNVQGTIRVAEACADRHANLLFLSSTSVYGALEGDVDEATPLDSVELSNPYAESKLHAEQRLEELAERGLRYVVARCGTMYGPSPGLRFHTAISKFCWQAAIGAPLGVWQTAMDQRRPYLDLMDTVNAIHFLIEHDLFDGRVFNVVTETATVRNVVDILAAIVPGLRVDLIESSAMTSRSQLVSSARIRAQGFEFRGGLRAGIRDTMQRLHGLRDFQQAT